MSNETEKKPQNGKSLRITHLKGVEKVNIEGIAKTGTFTGINGVYVKIWYKGSPQEYIVGPFASQDMANEAEDLINP